MKLHSAIGWKSEITAKIESGASLCTFTGLQISVHKAKIKKISVFGVTGLKILDMVGTHIF